MATLVTEITAAQDIDVTVDGTTLKRTLTTLKKAIGRRSPLPITAYVRITAEGETLTLTATNLDMVLAMKIPADVRTSGAVCIEPKMLLEAAALGAPVSVRVTDGTAFARAGSLIMPLPSMPADDFPAIATDGDTSIACVGADALIPALTYVSSAADKDGTRPVLTGVNCRFEGDTITLESTDGFRMHRRTVQGATIVTECVVNIPAAACTLLAAIAKTGTVSLSTSERGALVSFQAGTTTLVTRTLHGQYPPLHGLWPSRLPNTWMVNSAELRTFLTSAKKLRATYATIAPSDGGMTATMGEYVGQPTATAHIDGMADGPRTDPFSFEPAYVLDAMSGDVTTFYLSDTDIGPVQIDSDAVVMPKRPGQRSHDEA